MKRPSRSGFTLTELLAGVCILSLLIALLVPAAKRGFAAAQTGKCTGNLRAIGGGLMAYIADHDGDFPPCAQLPNSDYKISFRQKTYWFDALNSYMGHPDYAADRKDPFPAPDSTDKGFPFAWQLCPAKKVVPLQRQSVGYGWNLSNFGNDLSGEIASPGTGGFGSRLSQVAQPSRTIIVGDSLDDPLTSPGSQAYNRYIYDYDKEKSIPYPKRHGGGGNYLFVDGHVEWSSADRMKTPDVTKLFKKSR